MEYEKQVERTLSLFLAYGKEGLAYQVKKVIEEAYDKGYKKGISTLNDYNEGYSKGYSKGYNDGCEDSDTRYK